ncbi:hypothetical protein EIN_229800 [Entamoeba invadens IP1]|uniref:tRNA-guanine(15) transglycosylase-like domain-containing protein n=1 Tax=Entamoeba invadens IP1 TaxID=370355 RepID=A0A0A1U317_ENTIV|nr:hypothetical protein EIN_229800 [Entamoeba invadens IP1]ELP88447.1 hypothetical protein EIN_229800 [Entamoeba invadens IP1]|eukprot:XP_004255218.1 hypothetical protein EIN_229800 [Entamoeba invadens IP1]
MNRYEAKDYLIKSKMTYKKYFMLPETTNHILTLSLVNSIDECSTKLSKSDFNLTTRGGYRPITPTQIVEFATQAGFAQVEGVATSPAKKKRSDKKLKITRDVVIRALKQMVATKTEIKSPLEIVASVNLCGRGDAEYVNRVKALGITSMVFDCEYIEDQNSLISYVEAVLPECSGLALYAKVYKFELEKYITFAQKGISVWTNGISEITMNGQMEVFPISLDTTDQTNTTIDMYDEKWKEMVDVVAEKDCKCFTCSKNNSVSYVHHLLLCHELTGSTLVSLHNVTKTKVFEVFLNELINSGDKAKFEKFENIIKALVPPPQSSKRKLYESFNRKEEDD